MQDKLFMNAEEVANILGVSKAHAYKLIQRLNGELSAKGFIVIPGKISRFFFESSPVLRLGFFAGEEKQGIFAFDKFRDQSGSSDASAPI